MCRLPTDTFRTTVTLKTIPVVVVLLTPSWLGGSQDRIHTSSLPDRVGRYPFPSRTRLVRLLTYSLGAVSQDHRSFLLYSTLRSDAPWSLSQQEDSLFSQGPSATVCLLMFWGENVLGVIPRSSTVVWCETISVSSSLTNYRGFLVVTCTSDEDTFPTSWGDEVLINFTWSRIHGTFNRFPNECNEGYPSGLSSTSSVSAV